jgi:hypothetical protein
VAIQGAGVVLLGSETGQIGCAHAGRQGKIGAFDGGVDGNDENRKSGLFGAADEREALRRIGLGIELEPAGRRGGMAQFPRGIAGGAGDVFEGTLDSVLTTIVVSSAAAPCALAISPASWTRR